MKTEMYAICRIMLSLAILSAALIIGGASGVAAQERFVFEVNAENVRSKVTTTMQVYAPNERQAKENVSANGWKVLSIRQLTYRQINQIPMQIGESMPTVITLGPDGNSIASSPAPNAKPAGIDDGAPRLTDEELILSLLGPPVDDANLPPSGTIPARPSDGSGGNGNNLTADGEKPGAYIVESDGEARRNNGAAIGGDVGDVLGLTPESDQLEHLFTVYFELGVIEPTLSVQDTATLAALNKDRKYYLFGNTDDVVVMDNPYYKDNFDLSFKRAEAIKALMVSGGMNPANMTTVGLAYLYPRVENRQGPGGTPENRRVEVYGLR